MPNADGTPKKRGRPKGVKNRRVEAPTGRRPYQMMMDAVTHRVLKIHALRREISLVALVNDVLNCWIAAVTDYDQAIFRETLPPRTRAPKAPERFAGYLDSLGFTEAPQAPLAPPALPSAIAPQFIPASVPAFQPQTYTNPAAPPPSTATITLADLARPYRHPLAHEGPASYPHPAPSLPHNAALFNEEAHNAMAPNPGHGSAAQEATNGQPPAPEQHPLPREVEAYMDFYRVKPEDVR